MINGYLFEEKHTIHIYWSRVILYTEENAQVIPEKSGVYEILVKGADGYMRRYVGQADNLNIRYLQHLSSEEENPKIREGVRNNTCGFDYALVDDEDDRKDAEKALYEKYDYIWNDKEPEGSGRNLDIEVIEHSL